MLVLPGPAIVVIPIGLAILAAEFSWARRWLRKLRPHTRASQGRLDNQSALDSGDTGPGDFRQSHERPEPGDDQTKTQ